MALSKIDVANMVTGATPVANGGTGQTTFAAAGLAKRPNAKPLIINGDMAVAQRSTSATSITGNGVNSIDRMYWAINSIGTYTCAQESLTSGPAFEAGFANAMRIDTTSADASPASADYLYMQYNFEGQDLQLFKKGTSSAEKFTLAFWVKSNKTGQANVEFKDKDNSNRHAIGSYTISSADTWEHKIVVINADTTGAFGDDNGKSLNINWWLDSGDNFTGVAEGDAAWLANDDDRANNDGALQIARNTANDWAITGIQLEVGEYTSATLPPFQHEDFDENKKRCARYYYKVAEYGADGLTNQTIGMGYYKSTSQWRILCYLPVRPRTNPSLDSTSGTDYYVNDLTGIDDTFNGVELTRSNSDILQVVHVASNVSGTVGQAGESVAVASGAYIAFNAEL
jgi:hypothetical protein